MPLPGALKGFQDYLVVCLQDLASQAEQIDLAVPPLQLNPSPRSNGRHRRQRPKPLRR